MSNRTKVEELILKARIRMMIEAPFFGHLAMRLIIKDGSGWLQTAGTDGRYLYYNKKFFESLNRKEVEFVLAHEVMHCVYDHMSRRQGRDPTLWNCAGDFVINQDLKDAKIGNFPRGIKILLNEKYKEKSADEIYNMLLEDQNNGNGDDDMDSFDTHIDSEDNTSSGAGEGSKKVKPDPSGFNGPVPLSDEDKKMIAADIKHAVMDAAKSAGAGETPASVRRMVQDLTEPKMDWREIIQLKVQSSFRSDFTFSIPNRKTMQSGFILPGMPPEQRLDVDIALDTSGSISHSMLMDFLGEVKSIMDQYSEFTLRLWTFDTEVYNLQEYNQGNSDELLEYDIQGCGGTDFDVNWKYMKENDIEPNLFIVFTDGYPYDSWGDPNYCDTIFVIHGSKEIQAPFGTTVYYEEE
jgi:predicted metal-dependent peptidase